jgi:hypothetical protein
MKSLFSDQKESLISGSILLCNIYSSIGDHQQPRSMISATGSSRKVPEIAGTWKQYFGRNFLGFFLVDYYQHLVLSSRNRLEIIGKTP